MGIPQIKVVAQKIIGIRNPVNMRYLVFKENASKVPPVLSLNDQSLVF